jgi:pilus assembly protein CpaB
MQPKSVILLLVALGCGLVASIGITQVISRRAQPTVPVGETIPILVAKDTIPAWTPLSAQMVKLEPWPKDRLPEGAVTQIESVEGRRTKTPIYPGEPILEKKLFDKNANEHGPTVMIPKGMRVVTVKVDQVSGGSGLILPGDRVDVAVVLRPDPLKGITEPMTKTFLQDIKVFAVNDQFHVEGATPEEKTIQAKTVSLLVTPEQAQMIMLASEAGKIQLVMRSPIEQDQAQVKPVRLRDILDITEKSDREKESLAKSPPDAQASKDKELLERFKEFLKSREKTPPAVETVSASGAAGHGEPATPKPEQWTMRLLKAAQVEDLVLEKSPGGWGVASSRTYGPPSTSSGSSGAGPGGGSGAGGVATLPPKDGQKSVKPQVPGRPGAVPGSSPPGGALPEMPEQSQPADLPHRPGQANSQPAAGQEILGNPPEPLPPSGEDAPPNLLFPASGET